MSDGRPIIVEIENKLPDADGVPVPKGRYLVLETVSRNGTPVADLQFIMTAFPEGGKIYLMYPSNVKFVGYRGDCMMCSKMRKVEGI